MKRTCAPYKALISNKRLYINENTPSPPFVWALHSHINGTSVAWLCVEGTAPLCVTWQAWLLKCHPDHSGDTRRHGGMGRDLGKWDVDCAREGKDTERGGRQGSHGKERKTQRDGGERCRVRQCDYKVREGSMKGWGGFQAEKTKGEEGVVKRIGKNETVWWMEKWRRVKAREER